MKKYLICGFLFFILINSLTVSAQWNRHYGRYTSRYYHYDRYPARASVSIIARLPFGAVSVMFGNRYYHYHNGVYYRPYDRGYIIVQPPIGIIVPSLPFGCTRVIIRSNPYYRYENIFYAPYGNRYKVVEEPKETENSTADNETTNKTAGNEYEKVILEGKTYYKKGNKYYKASVNKDGEIIYEEAGETSKTN